jgi:hypothetical protein
LLQTKITTYKNCLSSSSSYSFSHNVNNSLFGQPRYGNGVRYTAFNPALSMIQKKSRNALFLNLTIN